MDFTQGLSEGTFKDVFKSNGWVFSYFANPRVAAVIGYVQDSGLYNVVWTNLRSSLESFDWLAINAPDEMEAYLNNE